MLCCAWQPGNHRGNVRIVSVAPPWHFHQKTCIFLVGDYRSTSEAGAAEFSVEALLRQRCLACQANWFIFKRWHRGYSFFCGTTTLRKKSRAPRARDIGWELVQVKAELCDCPAYVSSSYLFVKSEHGSKISLSSAWPPLPVLVQIDNILERCQLMGGDHVAERLVNQRADKGRCACECN